jgi:subtilase family serine protease
MKNNRPIFFLFLFLFTTIHCIAQQKPEKPSGQILRAHNPAILKKLKPVGVMDPAAPMDLVLELALHNEDAMMNKLRDLYDPRSRDFRQFLTPAQFTEQYGPDKQEFEEVLNFAKSNGLKVVNAPANRAIVHIEAPAKTVEKVFHVKMLMYKNPDNGKEFHAPSGDATIISALKNLEVFGLNDFENTIPQKFGVATPAASATDISMSATRAGSGVNGALMGNDFRNAYVPNSSLNGAGQTVGIVSRSDFSNLDINLYELTTARPDVPIRRVYINGLTQFVNPPPMVNGALNSNTEISMDIEMVISMAPGAQITVYGSGSSVTEDILNEIANPTMGEPLPNQITTSFNLNYGGDDSPRVYHAYYQMGLQGQSFFAYSGDNGAFGIFATGIVQPFSPGDFPYVTSVGGTNLIMNGNGATYSSESAWIGGGGGPSPYFGIPYYQTGLSNSGNFASTTHRNCPDVAMPASNIFVISNGGAQSNVGGTSAATPLWAGFMALVNEQAALNNLPPVGFLNPSIYTIARLPGYDGCFHDIKDGSGNTHTGETQRYVTVQGYDLATGLGSPNGLNLINALALRMPDPLEAEIKYVPATTDGCDPGPVAGSTARYHVSVSQGTAPFSYKWKGGNGVNIEVAIHLNPSDVNITVPALGQTGQLSVVITDANGSTFTAGPINISGIDPAIAEKDHEGCEFFHRIKYRFPVPIYIDPGDPYRKFELSPYSETQLRGLREDVTGLGELLKSMQQK